MRRLARRQMLKWTQRGLFAAAFVMLGYCGYVVADTWTFQRGERQQFEHLLTAQLADRSVQARNDHVHAVREAAPAPIADGMIGRIDVARLGLSAMVMEGTGSRTLRRAVGHIEGTSMPGLPGNVGISGHRDTFFRPLRNIRQDDIILLTTLQGEYRYRVLSIRVVEPEDVAVLDAGENEVLTLVTCYPFYFVGAAPKRFIVRAERVT